MGSARVRRPSTSKRIESQQFNWHYGSAQRRFAPIGLRNHPDWVFAVIRSKCSIYRGIDVRFTLESVFDLAGIGTHGAGGDFLKDKTALNVITSGGTRETYQRDGFNRFTIQEFLRPFEQTARLCKMTYLPPFAVQGTYRLTDAELSGYADDYFTLLEHLSAGTFENQEMQLFSFLNDWIAASRRNPAP